jgi:hypothetical protein
MLRAGSRLRGYGTFRLYAYHCRKKAGVLATCGKSTFGYAFFAPERAFAKPGQVVNLAEETGREATFPERNGGGELRRVTAGYSELRRVPILAW